MLSTKPSSTFENNYYLIRRKILVLFGGVFYGYDKDKNIIFWARQKPFRLKEDFRIYSDKSKETELLTIKTPQIIDIGATYNVQDKVTGEMVGALQRKFLRSLFKDEWIFISKNKQEIGKLTETSLIGALFRRIVPVGFLIPQKYIVVSLDGRKIAEIRRYFNPIILKYDLKIEGTENSIDKRLLVAMMILLTGIERRQR